LITEHDFFFVMRNLFLNFRFHVQAQIKECQLVCMVYFAHF